MRLRETARSRNDADRDVPEVFLAMMLLETSAAVFGFADVDELQPTYVGFAEEKVETNSCKFVAFKSLVKFGTRNDDRLDDASGNFCDTDAARFAGGAIDLDGFAERFHLQEYEPWSIHRSRNRYTPTLRVARAHGGIAPPLDVSGKSVEIRSLDKHMELIDNNNRLLVDDLKAEMLASSKLKVAASYFFHLLLRGVEKVT